MQATYLAVEYWQQQQFDGFAPAAGSPLLVGFFGW